MNPQKENSQTDKKSENVGRGRGSARPLRSYLIYMTFSMTRHEKDYLLIQVTA